VACTVLLRTELAVSEGREQTTDVFARCNGVALQASHGANRPAADARLGPRDDPDNVGRCSRSLTQAHVPVQCPIRPSIACTGACKPIRLQVVWFLRECEHSVVVVATRAWEDCGSLTGANLCSFVKRASFWVSNIAWCKHPFGPVLELDAGPPYWAGRSCGRWSQL
jgi:hypothetical protein